MQKGQIRFREALSRDDHSPSLFDILIELQLLSKTDTKQQIKHLCRIYFIKIDEMISFNWLNLKRYLLSL